MFMPINEQLSFSVSFGGNVKASASATINDTSRPAYEYMLVGSNPSTTEITEIDIPTYILASNKTSVNEGETITFTLSTTMLDTGTIVPYTITGVTLTDLNSGALTGSFTTDATGKSVLQVQISDDNLTEGIETLTITLNGKGISKSVTINDTSVLVPTYNVGWYSDAGGVNPISATNEGSSVYLVLKTTAVVDGTNFSVGLSGTNITIGDVASGTLVGSITVNSNIGYLNLSFVNDLTTEGAETITATVKSGSTTVGTNTLVINDTSVSTTYAVNIYDSPVNGSIVTSNAGTEVYGRITLTNGVSGHVFSVSVTGVTAIVDGQKTWTSGNLNFNMSFTSTGTATITFRNDTLNTVIGTKTISVTKISSGNGLFTVASVSDRNGYNWRGYDSINSSYTYGVELNDTLKYNNSLVESQICSLHIAENGALVLQYWCGNVWLFNADPVLNFKLTNMTTGETYITGNVTGGILMMNVMWWHVVPVGSQALLNRMFTAGQNIKIEFV
jgi:hypothetical protein